MEREIFGKIDGKNVYRYTLTEKDISVCLLNYGATVQSLFVGGINIVRSFKNAIDYKMCNEYVCSAVGRVANRISKAKYTLNGKTYYLTKNEGENHLHGGAKGFNSRFYTVQEIDNGLRMTCKLKNGEDGYAGNMTFTVDFVLAKRTLNIKYIATADKDTLFAPTHHFYFNLNGTTNYANSNKLIIYADSYAITDKALIPTGEIAKVDNTLLDFRQIKAIDKDMPIGIYDNTFILNNSHAATLVGDKTGVKMEIHTDMPSIQLYTGAGDKRGRVGEGDTDCSGIALEPQFVPNAINMEGFAKPILKANSSNNHYIKLVF